LTKKITRIDSRDILIDKLKDRLRELENKIRKDKFFSPYELSARQLFSRSGPIDEFFKPKRLYELFDNDIFLLDDINIKISSEKIIFKTDSHYTFDKVDRTLCSSGSPIC